MDNRNKSGAISQIAVTLILKHYQKKLVAKWNFRPTDGSERVTVFQQPRDKLLAPCSSAASIVENSRGSGSFAVA
jgi:hypothetical protein